MFDQYRDNMIIGEFVCTDNRVVKTKTIVLVELNFGAEVGT